MPFYHTLGKIPPKRHTQFRKPDGSLYYEQLFGTIGFDGMYSNMYHEQRPTQVKELAQVPQAAGGYLFYFFQKLVDSKRYPGSPTTRGRLRRGFYLAQGDR